MRVRALMAAEPVSVEPGTSVEEAILLMREHSIRHLPVVDAARRVVGWATLADLRRGLIPSMVAGLNLSDLMVRDPYTVGPDDDVEDAAQLIYLKKIGGLPVVGPDRVLVGVITVTDILRAFIEMMGLLTQSWRLDVDVAGKPGGVRDVSRIIQENGGRVLSVAMAPQQEGRDLMYFRIEGTEVPRIREAVRGAGYDTL